MQGPQRPPQVPTAAHCCVLHLIACGLGFSTLAQRFSNTGAWVCSRTHTIIGSCVPDNVKITDINGGRTEGRTYPLRMVWNRVSILRFSIGNVSCFCISCAGSAGPRLFDSKCWEGCLVFVVPVEFRSGLDWRVAEQFVRDWCPWEVSIRT